jgi:hypothetical protein
LYFLTILYNSLVILSQMSPPTRHEKALFKFFFCAALLRSAALALQRKYVYVLHQQPGENIEKK